MRNIVVIFCWLPLLTLNFDARAAAEARGERPSIDLSGDWEFKLDPLDVGRAEKWFEAAVAYQRTIRVPGAWNAQGVAFESKEQLRAYEEQRLEEQKPLNKIGTLGVQRESDRLFSTYPGPGWYRKTVTIPADWKGKVPWIEFAGVHREAEVWVNGKRAGAHHSYLTPFRIDLAPHAKAGDTITVAVRVDARRNPEVDPLIGCMDTLDFLYVTWGGIHRPVKLEAVAPTRIEDVFIVPRIADETAEIRVAIEGPKTGKLAVAADVFDADGAVAASVEPFVVPPLGGGASNAEPAKAGTTSETVFTIRLAKPKLWSPKSPHLYTARVRLLNDGVVMDARAIRFGMREFKVVGSQFLLNGQPIFLRGYGDDSIFPNTISPPSDKGEFRRRLSLARDYGFNFVRHHSWTPPEEYLEAADELGMMLQPEFPLGNTWDKPKTPAAKRAALEQWEASIRLNRNHPSVVSWCMGNEQYDSFDQAPAMYEIARRLDPTRPIIDTDGSSKERPTLDYNVVPMEGNSIGFQDGKYNVPARFTKPVIAHEMGYFVTLQNLAQLDLFKHGMRPYWLFQARDLATKHGMLDVYPDWLAASYRLQAVCLKSNMEAARRSRLSGTSVWLFQDYPNCAEGVVDMFFQPKGVLPEEFRKYNGPTVLLLDTPRRSWWSGENAKIKFVVSRFEDAPSQGATLRWKLTRDGGAIAEGAQVDLAIESGGVQELPAINIEMPKPDGAAKLTLSVELTDANGKADNSWSFWVFPRDLLANASSGVRAAGFDAMRAIYPDAVEQEDAPVPADTKLLVTTRLGDTARRYLEDGGRVLLLEPERVFEVEKTNFRLSSWDGGGPSGTILDPRHPALRTMPTEGWCDLQFYYLIQGSKTILLDPLPAKIEPLVRCIDRSTRLANRGYLFEASVGRGKFLVSGFNFTQALAAKDPGGIFLFDKLLRYALGPDFAPEVSLPAEALKGKATK